MPASPGPPAAPGPQDRDPYQLVGVPPRRPVPPTEMGYALVAAQGELCGFGSLGGEWADPVLTPAQQPAGLAFTPSGRGCWLVSTDGAVVCRGDAPYIGCPKDLGVVVPAAAVATPPDGLGYYVAVEDGGVYTFGSAAFFGSVSEADLNQPIVDMTMRPDGDGYWTMAADGGVFAFGARAVLRLGSGGARSPPRPFPSPPRHRGAATGWPRAPVTCSRSVTPSTSAAWPTSACVDPSSACALPARYSDTGWPARAGVVRAFGDTYFLGCLPPATLAPPFVAFGAAGAV